MFLLMFTPKIGEDDFHFDEYNIFSEGLVQPPTIDEVVLTLPETHS